MLTGHTIDEEDSEEEYGDLEGEDEAGMFEESGWEDEGWSETPTPGRHPLPELKGKRVILVIDQSGLHKIRIHPCQCQGALPLDIQYL
jgi:hypothetical protein